MNSLRSSVLLIVLTFLSAPAGMAQEQLGKVTFPTSCDPKVQAQFERGVAMLHSYWFTEAGKVFDAVAKQDPNCVMAYWGYAVNLLGNSLASAPAGERCSGSLGGARTSPHGRRENAARARLDRGNKRLLPRL